MLRKVALSMGCVMLAATAFADTSDIQASNNQIGSQFISTHFNYTETGNGILGTQTGTLDTETGWVLGAALSISTMKDWWLGNDYIAAEYNHSFGNTQYVGALQEGGTYGSVVQQSGVKLDNYSARWGKGFVANDKLMLSPYTELGHYKCDRWINYGETYTHHYYGVGVLGQYSPVGRQVFSFNAMIGRTFGSNIAVNGPAGFSGSLGNSTLYRVGASADYAFTKNFHGNAGIDYMSFQYGISALYPLGGGFVTWEPDSQTNYTTIKLGFGYAF